MEDRGQVMNAVETWNRYLNFEHDPRWQQEGRERLKALEEKLNRLKSHQSRMQQRLATPQAMRALAADRPRWRVSTRNFPPCFPSCLTSAFPLPVDRSRGSPCSENARPPKLFSRSRRFPPKQSSGSLARRFLPPATLPLSDDYLCAAHALSRAIDADTRGYTPARNDGRRRAAAVSPAGHSGGRRPRRGGAVYALQRFVHF